ncbi:MAG TPA: galactokinase [Bryobacteraceae bacterium]|nr:galactokinase [Bryobacteraceae bacterium]
MAGPAQRVIEAFEARYRSTPDVARAPGRVNLIGEHTDYNLGFVLPIAIDLACYAASAPNRENVFRVHSENVNQSRQWTLDQIPNLRPTGDWSDYIIGIARQLELGRGRDLLVYSTVPLGSGLSSSASLEVATALALGWPGDLPSLDLAKLARRAENEFIGLPSGIMDQYVSVFGRENAALCIDCRNLAAEPVDLPSTAAIVTVNSMVKHELGQSAYRQRVEECARAAREMQAETLRDASIDQLAQIQDPVAKRRARHILTENQRVSDFIAASRESDLAEMGRLLIASHTSLQQDYEVSCAELDFLVEEALKIPGVHGARMTGAGFGGCTVNLIDPTATANFESTLRTAYQKRFNLDPTFHTVHPSSGATRLS